MDSSDQRHNAPTCCYIVVEITGTWWIDVEGKPFGPCEDKEDAITCAFKLIDIFGDRTRPAAVYAPDGNGRTRLIWKGQMGEGPEQTAAPVRRHQVEGDNEQR